jgi:hypothetical protein
MPVMGGGAGDIDRIAFTDAMNAHCHDCEELHLSGLTPAVTARKAIGHVRATGHTVFTEAIRYTRYRPADLSP